MHCDSEELCSYPISDWKPRVKNPLDQMTKSLIYGDPIEKFVDYKSTIESKFNLSEQSYLGKD